MELNPNNQVAEPSAEDVVNEGTDEKKHKKRRMRKMADFGDEPKD